MTVLELTGPTPPPAAPPPPPPLPPLAAHPARHLLRPHCPRVLRLKKPLSLPSCDSPQIQRAVWPQHLSKGVITTPQDDPVQTEASPPPLVLPKELDPPTPQQLAASPPGYGSQELDACPSVRSPGDLNAGQMAGCNWKPDVRCNHSFQFIAASTLLPSLSLSRSLYDDGLSFWGEECYGVKSSVGTPVGNDRADRAVEKTSPNSTLTDLCLGPQRDSCGLQGKRT
ncbi:proline-rich protein 36-like [Schistocerca americana]|uniref:proline-rich protein 36-like n=1 Tax=Schistocerca americana TaxID=7009 RepID=UPI001F4F2B5B|nr:proline-rich protein 36-like [Schistocerca americana]